MDLRRFDDDDGHAYMAKGHVDLADFMAAVRAKCDEGDPILDETPEHCWMRYTRNFAEGCQSIGEAAPESKGAFKATWVQYT